MKKAIIVGSGIVGCVLARELAKKDYGVTVYERRKHVGGNLYDFDDEYGVHVHRYGPHIFHTGIESVWQYVTRFCDFKEYSLICGSEIDGKCVPTMFDFKSIDTFFPEESETLKQHIKQCFWNARSATIVEMLDCDDPLVQKYARFLYEKDYAPYTAKQWGMPLEEVDRSVFKRVPVLFYYSSRYFHDTHEAIPLNGYMELINNLLDHSNITVETDIDALDFLSIDESSNSIVIDSKPTEDTVIYTGPIDELFNCKYGRLPYRSLRFEWKHENIDSFQPYPIVVYPQAEGYTRITEYKKLPNQDVSGTTYAIEYPVPYLTGENNEPYYPVQTIKSQTLHKKYLSGANKIKGLVCCGRLGDFKYYNMDQAVKRALQVAKDITKDIKA